MITLSFCAIVRNEAQNLARCLESVKPYVDELVVVDTGSTDDTVVIAQQYGATVSHFEWCDDFAAARNYAGSLVSGDWILTLDADEALEVSQENWRAQFSDSGSEHLLAFNLGLRDAGNSATELQIPRLFRNVSSVRYCDHYHEYLTHEGQALSAHHPRVQSLEGVEIVHYGYAEELLAAKSLRRIPMLEKIRATAGLSLMLLWTLSGMYEATEALDQAQNCYEEAWERLLPALLTGEAPQDTRSVRSWLYSLAVRSLQSEDVETAQLICQQSIIWFPDYPPFTYLTGLMLKLPEQPGDSVVYFEKCLEAGKTGHYFKGEPFDPLLISLYPAFDIGTVYLARQQVTQAIAAFELLALSFDPNFTAAQEHLAIAQQLL